MADLPGHRLLASLELPAAMESWDQLIAFIRDQSQGQPMDPRRAYGMLLASEELLSNMIRAASEVADPPAEPLTILIRSWLCEGPDATTFALEISYNGSPYDPRFDEIPDAIPDIPIEERPIGGLGLYLVKTSVDSVTYSYGDGRNTYVLASRVG